MASSGSGPLPERLRAEALLVATLLTQTIQGRSVAARVVDVSGLYVTPGLIDLHAHAYGTR